MRELEAGSPADRRAVERYYEKSWLDTRVFWLGGGHLGIHLGYWDGSVRSHAESVLAMNRAMAARADLQPGQRVLDAGCGVGGSAIWLARTFGARVTGIDISAAHVARAQRYVRRRGVEELVDVRRADAACTFLPREGFDVAWLQESLCHAPDKGAVLAELARVLRPGGRLVVEDAFLREPPHDDAGKRRLDAWLSGLALPGLLSPEGFAEKARGAGFADVELEDIHGPVRCSIVRMRRLLRLSAPFAAGLRAVRLRSAVQAGHMRGLMAMCCALEEGLWFPAIGLARKPCEGGVVAW